LEIFWGFKASLVRLPNQAESSKQTGCHFSGLLQIGMGYALGIIFAVNVCAGTSGGHFNPSVTITLVFFKGFPKAKALR